MISQYCPEVWDWYRKRRIVRDAPSMGYWISEGGRLIDQLDTESHCAHTWARGLAWNRILKKLTRTRP